MEDFCLMPDDEPSIYIDKESKYITKKNILSNLRAQKFGMIENIELAAKCDQGHETVYNKVFVHFKKWNTYYMDPPDTSHVCLSTIRQLIDDFIAKNENAIRTRFALITGKKLNFTTTKKISLPSWKLWRSALSTWRVRRTEYITLKYLTNLKIKKQKI